MYAALHYWGALLGLNFCSHQFSIILFSCPWAKDASRSADYFALVTMISFHDIGSTVALLWNLLLAAINIQLFFHFSIQVFPRAQDDLKRRVALPVGSNFLLRIFVRLFTPLVQRDYFPYLSWTIILFWSCRDNRSVLRKSFRRRRPLRIWASIIITIIILTM